MSTDNVNTEVTVPETPVAAAPAAAPEGAPGGAQPAPEQSQPTPAQDHKPGSEPMIPLSRFNEVIRERNELRQKFAPPQQPQHAQGPAQSPKPEDFNGDYDAYQAAVIDFRVQQGISQYAQQQQRQEQVRQYQDRAAKADMNFTKKLTEAAAKDPTVIAVLQAAPALRPDLQVNLGEYPEPVALAKHLATNPELVFEMNNLPPDLAVQRMWMIGQSLAGSKTQPASASKAPPPISPVGSGKTNTTGTYRDDMSQEEFNATFKPLW